MTLLFTSCWNCLPKIYGQAPTKTIDRTEFQVHTTLCRTISILFLAFHTSAMLFLCKKNVSRTRVSNLELRINTLIYFNCQEGCQWFTSSLQRWYVLSILISQILWLSWQTVLKSLGCQNSQGIPSQSLNYKVVALKVQSYFEFSQAPQVLRTLWKHRKMFSTSKINYSTQRSDICLC